MSLIQKLEFPDAKFDLYFLGYDSAKAASGGRNVWDREGLIELTHNYGTETDAEYKINNGNVEPHRGFGHTCISVDNIQAACQRIEDAGYKFQKKLSDGRMRHIAFALDPDGYWVEIIGQKPVEETENVKETDVETYRMVCDVFMFSCRFDVLTYRRTTPCFVSRTQKSRSSFIKRSWACRSSGSTRARRAALLCSSWATPGRKECLARARGRLTVRACSS